MKNFFDIRYSRKFKRSPSSITISRNSKDKFCGSFLVKEEISILSVTTKAIGVDLGLNHVFVTSHGGKQRPSKALKRALKKLKGELLR